MGQSIPSAHSEILLRCLEMESDSISTRFYFTVVPDDPDSFVVEPGIRRPIVRDKVQIPEQEPFHLGIAKMAAHRLLMTGKSSSCTTSSA
jgi:hypothetical protein